MGDAASDADCAADALAEAVPEGGADGAAEAVPESDALTAPEGDAPGVHVAATSVVTEMAPATPAAPVVAHPGVPAVGTVPEADALMSAGLT